MHHIHGVHGLIWNVVSLITHLEDQYDVEPIFIYTITIKVVLVNQRVTLVKTIMCYLSIIFYLVGTHIDQMDMVLLMSAFCTQYFLEFNHDIDEVISKYPISCQNLVLLPFLYFVLCRVIR